MKIALFALALAAGLAAQPAQARPHHHRSSVQVDLHLGGGYGSRGAYRGYDRYGYDYGYGYDYDYAPYYAGPRYDRYNRYDRYDRRRHYDYDRHSRRESRRHHRRSHH